MQQILKRLELIKTAIILEDAEIIELQIIKMASLVLDDEAKQIIELLKSDDYDMAVGKIEIYIEQNKNVVPYEDKEVGKLRQELKKLETKLQTLSETKNTYQNDIEAFNREYNLHLGDIIAKILKMKKKILQKKTAEKAKHFEAKKKQYDNTKKEYELLKNKIDKLELELEEIDDFDDKYDEVYAEIQKLKKELLKQEELLNNKRREAKKAKQDLDDDPAQQAYKEASDTYDEFHKEYDEISKEKRIVISDEEKTALKKLYREASRLCHPDIVTEELRAQAQAIFQELNDAYVKNDMEKVQEILQSLVKGTHFDVSSDTIDDKEILKVKIEEFQKKIEDIQYEIDNIINDETYHLINEIDDMEAYFEERKKMLTQTLEELNEEFTKDSHKNKQKMMLLEEDSFWEEEF